ncbi:actin-binding Rho-activating protein-like [Scleropages formosus]|uniref:Actin-binding Rho-activating protein-like n=1 Tax=Scleropages formosus TaxID=113540 RepID=A0A0P7W0C0_SCLFO|nr:actin-binding Rho-activating protein-like [Scleropages formosus]KPP79800.1 actin-binding Rho-activating protein-like [Scleropages formosus]
METRDTSARADLLADPSAGPVRGLKDSWQNWCRDQREYQERNPFSGGGGGRTTPRLTKGQEGYGRPPQGSKTEQRGFDAHSHVGREVRELCGIIRDVGRSCEDGSVIVEFGRLFERYVTISNKVVGVLLRARRQGLVRFQGEMLWQGRDDQVVITLLP